MTLLVGDNTQVAVAASVGGNPGGSAARSLKVAVASGQGAVGYFYTTTTGVSFIMFIQDSAGNLISTSNASANSISGWNSVVFASPIAISNGTTYGVAVLTPASTFYNQGTGGSGTWQYMNSGITFPTPPAAWTTSGTGSSSVDLSAYIDDGVVPFQVWGFRA
jgi:hypothetical protein